MNCLSQLLILNFFVGLDRKISVRATRDELIERGILLPDVASVGQSTSVSANMSLQLSRLPQHPNNFSPNEGPIHGKQKITGISLTHCLPFLCSILYLSSLSGI